MAPRISDFEKTILESHLYETFDNPDLRSIAAMVNTSYSTVQRVYKRMKEVETLKVDLRSKGGRPRLIGAPLDQVFILLTSRYLIYIIYYN